MSANTFRPYEIAQQALSFLIPIVEELEQLESQYEAETNDAVPSLAMGEKDEWDRASTAALETSVVIGPLRNAIGVLSNDATRRQYVAERYRL